jgi:hypothetical protein
MLAELRGDQDFAPTQDVALQVQESMTVNYYNICIYVNHTYLNDYL